MNNIYFNVIKILKEKNIKLKTTQDIALFNLIPFGIKKSFIDGKKKEQKPFIIDTPKVEFLFYPQTYKSKEVQNVA